MNVFQFTVDRVSANAKLYVYLTGTTTGAAFYTDPAGTAAGSNPLIADANGLFDPIYLDPSITYRVKVTNSAGSTTHYDIDPVRVFDEGTADGVLTVRSLAAAKKRAVPASVSAIYCAGYANKGDRGQALYSRVASMPSHDAYFTSADGAYWALSENELNPFMFGAKGDNSADDSAAIQAMFDYVTDRNTAYPMNFMGAKYYVATGLVLPRIAGELILDLRGAGATLRTDQAITILSTTTPANQTAAGVAGGMSYYEIHDFRFEGNLTSGQIGLHLMACYMPVVRSCIFSSVDYGSIGTFCLASAWRDNRYYGCQIRGAVVQSGVSYLTGSPVWTGATTSNSASNVSTFENCRVFGHPSQTSAFGVFGSDAVRMTGCISEGGGAKYDVHFDYQGSTTVKQFYVHMFHAEAPNGKVNFKVRATGTVIIDSPILQYPAALYDAQGSINCQVYFKNVAYLGNPPTPNGNPYDPVTNPNPNGRWFYHSGGNGFGAATEGTSGGGAAFRFEDCFDNAYLQFKDSAHWEGATLPPMLHVRGNLGANTGVQEWSNAEIVFGSPIWLADGGNLSGMMTGNVTSATTSVAANSSVTESFTVSGLKLYKHTVFVNPYNGAYVPPTGIVWTAWIENDNAFKIRFTNVTGSAITLATNATWRYCAPRSY